MKSIEDKEIEKMLKCANYLYEDNACSKMLENPCLKCKEHTELIRKPQLSK